jgi:hypothetical protein
LFFPLVFNYVFELVFRQHPTENSEEEHEKFPDVMRPFFSWSVTVGMYFHGLLLALAAVTAI